MRFILSAILFGLGVLILLSFLAIHNVALHHIQHPEHYCKFCMISVRINVSQTIAEN